MESVIGDRMEEWRPTRSKKRLGTCRIVLTYPRRYQPGIIQTRTSTKVKNYQEMIIAHDEENSHLTVVFIEFGKQRDWTSMQKLDIFGVYPRCWKMKHGSGNSWSTVRQAVLNSHNATRIGTIRYTTVPEQTPSLTETLHDNSIPLVWVVAPGLLFDTRRFFYQLQQQSTPSRLITYLPGRSGQPLATQLYGWSGKFLVIDLLELSSISYGEIYRELTNLLSTCANSIMVVSVELPDPVMLPRNTYQARKLDSAGQLEQLYDKNSLPSHSVSQRRLTLYHELDMLIQGHQASEVQQHFSQARSSARLIVEGDISFGYLSIRLLNKRDQQGIRAKMRLTPVAGTSLRAFQAVHYLLGDRFLHEHGCPDLLTVSQAYREADSQC